MTKAILERSIKNEWPHGLEYEKYAVSGRNGDDTWNEKSRKKLKTEKGDMEIGDRDAGKGI